MAIQKTLLSQGEQGIGNEDWYYFVSDPETGDKYVLHEWSHGGPGGFTPGEERFAIDEFLKTGGSAQNELRELLKKGSN